MVVRFPLERRLADKNGVVFEGNGKYVVHASMTDHEMNSLAERIFREDCIGCEDLLVYGKIRVGIGKARDKAVARQRGMAHSRHIDENDDELVEIESLLYAVRCGEVLGGGNG